MSRKAGKKLQTIIILVVIFSCLNLTAAPLSALAQTGTDEDCSGSISAGVKCFGNTAYGQSVPTPLVVIIARVINVLLELLALVFLILIIYGGTMWMTSMGQEDKIKKAKQAITNAAIGLLIVILSYAIVNSILYLLYESDLFYGDLWY